MTTRTIERTIAAPAWSNADLALTIRAGRAHHISAPDASRVVHPAEMLGAINAMISITVQFGIIVGWGK